MSQQDLHLTTEQISAMLDQQLTSEDLAACSAHLSGCDQCQSALDDLRQTVRLLRSLPQIEVPRSFTLSADFRISVDKNEQQPVEQSTVRVATSPRRLPTPLRRTLGVISALAAVIGLFFALSSFIATPRPTVSMSAAPAAKRTSLPAGSQSQSVPQATGPFANSGDNKNSTQLNLNPTTPSPVETRSQAQPQPRVTQNPPGLMPPLLDFNQPVVRLSIGILLAILGGTGCILFIQRKKPNSSPVKRHAS